MPALEDGDDGEIMPVPALEDGDDGIMVARHGASIAIADGDPLSGEPAAPEFVEPAAPGPVEQAPPPELVEPAAPELVEPAAPGPAEAPEDEIVCVPCAKAMPSASTRRQLNWKAALWGGSLCYDEYLQNGAMYKNWKFKCDRHGGLCVKTKGAQFTSRHGTVEPLAFLHAWREVAPTAGKTHAQMNPSHAEVAEIYDVFSEELQALHASYFE